MKYFFGIFGIFWDFWDFCQKIGIFLGFFVIFGIFCHFLGNFPKIPSENAL
jgi:hypothetical protein